MPNPDEALVLADVLEAVIRTALTPVVGRLRALETLAADVLVLRERLAALDARPSLPGPPGPPGADGLGFDAYDIDYDGERTLTHRWAQGDRTASQVVRLPTPIYRGVFVDGKIYERGDCVTVDGSLWHANVDTAARPGDGTTDWTLAVKRGRDRWVK